MHIKAFINTCIHTYIHIYIHTHKHSHIHMNTHKYIHTYVHTYTHIRTYPSTRIPVHTYTFTHTYLLTYLNKRCTNNQAEQLTILRALEYTETLQTGDKTATIYTDSRMTLDSHKNSKIHTFVIEEIRIKFMEMEKINWKIQLCSHRDTGK
jgi:hypothetical protein